MPGSLPEAPHREALGSLGPLPHLLHALLAHRAGKPPPLTIMEKEKEGGGHPLPVSLSPETLPMPPSPLQLGTFCAHWRQGRQHRLPHLISVFFTAHALAPEGDNNQAVRQEPAFPSPAYPLPKLLLLHTYTLSNAHSCPYHLHVA